MMGKIIKQNWTDDFVEHWKYYLPPARASPSDLDFIKKKIIEKGKGVNVLILGATPEYRTLCGELHVPVTLLDFSKRNYTFLTKEVKNIFKENFIEGNWLTYGTDEKYDLILGDNVINVVLTENVPRLLANVARMLKPNGLFIARTYVMEPRENPNIQVVLRNYRKNKLPLYTATSRDLYVSAYNYKKDYVVLKDIWKLIIKLYKEEKITENEFKKYTKLSLGRDFHFYIPRREHLNKLLSQFYTLVQTFYGSEAYLKNNFPLHVLAPISGNNKEALK